jgi:hypothetical protein
MNFIACFQESHSGELSKANFLGRFIKNRLFFFPSERILLLSDDKIILSKKFDFLAKVIVFIKRGLPKKFLIFLFLIPLEFPLAKIKAYIHMTNTKKLNIFFLKEL